MTSIDDNNSNEKDLMIVDATNNNYYNNANVSHKGKNLHSKKIEEQEELKKYEAEQLILLKEYKQNIIDFIIDNKDSIRIERFKNL